jgi:hypothetical protein
MPVDQVVVDNRRVAPFEQVETGVRADVSGATGHQNISHKNFPPDRKTEKALSACVASMLFNATIGLDGNLKLMKSLKIRTMHVEGWQGRDRR